jgi:hypothetical protein
MHHAYYLVKNLLQENSLNLEKFQVIREGMDDLGNNTTQGTDFYKRTIS